MQDQIKNLMSPRSVKFRQLVEIAINLFCARILELRKFEIKIFPVISSLRKLLTSLQKFNILVEIWE